MGVLIDIINAFKDIAGDGNSNNKVSDELSDEERQLVEELLKNDKPTKHKEHIDKNEYKKYLIEEDKIDNKNEKENNKGKEYTGHEEHDER